MTHLVGHDRSQTLLLPESLDDYIGPENPVRFIEAFVDGLDLAAAGFARVPPKEGYKYTIRLPANSVLQKRIGWLLKRPVGRPPHEVRRFHASFSYRAGS